MDRAVGVGLGVVFLFTLPRSSPAVPLIGVAPQNPVPGETVTLNLSGFTPSAIAAIRFDGVLVDTVLMPPDGTVSRMFTIPSSTSLSAHEFEACTYCGVYDFELSSRVRVAVGTGTMAPGECNYQIRAVEVTQGIRTSISERTPPAADLILPSDTVQHIANRKTFVRVYPWIDPGDGTISSASTCQLWATVEGTEYGPLIENSRVDGRRTLEEHRDSRRFSFDFILPAEWTALSSLVATKSIDLRFHINPTGSGECASCADDNDAWLYGMQFRHVGSNDAFGLTFRPYLVEKRSDDGSTIEAPTPTLEALLNVVRQFHEILPLADGGRGIRLMPWHYVRFDGPLMDGDRSLFDEQMIRDYLPDGRVWGTPVNEYYGFLGSDGCGGHSVGLQVRYFTVAACGPPPYVPAHELSHSIGQGHAGNGHGESGGGGYDMGYPGDHGQVEFNAFGMNVYDGTVYGPVAARSGSSIDPEELRHDFMAYGPSPDKWISWYTWNHLINFLNLWHPKGAMPAVQAMPANARVAAAGKVLSLTLITGQLSTDGTMTLMPFFGADTLESSPFAPTHELRFRGVANALISSTAVTLLQPMDVAGPAASLMAEVVPVPTDWITMELVDGSTVLASWNRSPSAPQVTLITPQSGFQWAEQGTEIVQWSGMDLDNEVLTYRVLGLRNGQIAQVLAGDVQGTSAEIDLAEIEGSGTWEIAVEVSDGFQHRRSASAVGWVAPKAPRPVILQPGPGQVLVDSEANCAQGVGTDWEDVNVNDTLVWFLDSQPTGQGSSMSLQGLATGVHVLELRATNAAQLQGTTTVQFQVVASLDPPLPLAPPDGTQHQSPPVLLQWQPVTGARSYLVRIAEDPQMTANVFESENLRGTELLYLDARPGRQYYWTVEAIQGESGSGESPAISFTTDPAPTAVDQPSRVSNLRFDARPNPFNPRTSIEFGLDRSSSTRLVLYDVSGRRVRVLVDAELAAGQHSRVWDGTDDAGNVVASGVYVARLSTYDSVRTLRVTLLR